MACEGGGDYDTSVTMIFDTSQNDVKCDVDVDDWDVFLLFCAGYFWSFPLFPTTSVTHVVAAQLLCVLCVYSRAQISPFS